MLPSSKISHTMNDANFLPPLPSSSSHIHPEYFQKRSTEFHSNRNARKQCFLMGPAATTVNWWIYEFTLAGGDYFHRAFHGLFSSGQNFGFWSSWSLFGVSDQPWAENCRLKSIGFRLMDPRWCNLINEYPRGGKQFH